MPSVDPSSLNGMSVTLWFLTTDDPGTVLQAAPPADRGFGRKYLSQLNPAWPVTPIGTFPLNRSDAAGEAEFYIGGFPRVTVVQTWVEGIDRLSDISEHLLNSLPAERIFAFAFNEEHGFGGFARWESGVLKRSLCATPQWLIEDVGLPDYFEADYWAGEKSAQRGGLYLPFTPRDIVKGAEKAWLGVDVSAEGPDIEVVGYAVDGRPEPKVHDRPARSSEQAGQLAETSAAKLGLGAGRGDYDDYSDAPDDEGEEFREWAEASGAALKRVGRGLRRGLRSTGDWLGRAAQKLRYTDRAPKNRDPKDRDPKDRDPKDRDDTKELEP